MDIVTKDYPVMDLGEPTEEFPHGSFEVILSTPSLDRDKEYVDAKALEPLPDHISFDTDHSMTCDTVVGSGTPSYAPDGTLRVKGGYCSDERSQMIRQKVKDGHIRATSVTMVNAERKRDEKGIPHVVKAELLCGTFTPVPANREAVVLSAKSILAKEGRRNSSSDAETIQQAHDLMGSLGANCGAKRVRVAKNAMSRVDSKAIVGSVEALQSRVSDALEDTYSGFCCLRGVIPTQGGGTVVYDAWDSDYDIETYRQAYTDDGTVVTLTGDPTVVDVWEVVTPDADADRETDDETPMKSAADSADPAAKAAGSAEPAADPTPAEIRTAVARKAVLFRGI